MGQGLDDRFTRIHPTMNPPVPRSGTRGVFPGVTGGSSLDDLRSHYKWYIGGPTNFPSGEGLVPQSHIEESQFQDYVTGSQSDRLTWPGDPAPWPAGDSDGPSVPRPTSAPIDQGIGSLAGTAPAPSGIARTPEWISENIPALGSLPSLVYTDPNTGETVDMRPRQSLSVDYGTTLGPGGIDTISYTPHDRYEWGNGLVTGSAGNLPSSARTDWADRFKTMNWKFDTGRPYWYTNSQGDLVQRNLLREYLPQGIPMEPDLNVSGDPMWQFQNASTGSTMSTRPW